ncbi:MAG TPA: PHP domain-containing protein [Symbiobacteriaceae bacterium]|nr:PHP domain-containing protein [Symbiobacteriaceae bacterium]
MITEISFRPEDEDRHITIPFDMPPGTARLEVSYTVTPLGPGECVVDLGCLQGDTIRGWTGSSRSSFFITAAQATPGYPPGPLTPGPWAVLLGTSRIPPDGATCTVTGDLHHHTHHSDGAHSVAEVMKLAEEAELDFIVLTDHNTVAGARELVDFRFRSIREFRRPAHGLVVLNHPDCDFCPWEMDFDFDHDLAEV